MSNGQSVVKEASDFMNGHDGYFDFNTQSMDYDFYAVPSGSGLDIEDPTRPDASWKEDATGTQTVTYTVSDLTGYWSHQGYGVPNPAPTAQYEYTISAAPVLETLTASGSLTNAQIVGTTPDLSGLTFTAGYSDGSSTTVSSSAITISPATYDASGNPMNLREVDLTLSYTDGEVTATTGVDNVVTHRPDVQALQAGQEGYVYFDFRDEFLNREGSSTNGPLGAMDLLQDGGSQGEWAVVFFDESSYTNDTTVDGTVLTGWISNYGIVAQETGTPNTQGFIPQTGYSWFGLEHMDQSYIAWSQDDTGSGTGTAYIVAAPLANNISAGVGYKKTDLDTTAQYAKVYQVNIV